jgi:hypothetical protein
MSDNDDRNFENLQKSYVPRAPQQNNAVPEAPPTTSEAPPPPSKDD